jgi:16S rRNA (guanine527-N7)-methyltransferase
MAAPLDAVVAEASRLGYLGGARVDVHVEHGRRFLAALPEVTRRVLDLGSGGGIPGLVLGVDRPDWHVVLLDRRAQRTDFLRRAVGRLGLANVEVVTGEASVLARRPEHRGRYDAVVARSFGAPAATAEAAAGFLRLGGVLVVSEAPEPDEARWPAAALAKLGLAPDDPMFDGLRRFRAVAVCPGEYPRRHLRPPLF